MTDSPSTIHHRVLRLLAWKRWIAFNTLIVGAAAVVVSLLLPKWYQSSTSIFPPEREGGVSSLLSGDGEGGRLSMSLMASLLGGSSFDMPLFSSPSDIMARILRSRTLGERLIRTYDLLDHYKVKTMDQALEILGRRMDVFVGREGVVTVAFLELDPRLAADMANDAVRFTDEIQRERRHSAAQTARDFVARRLRETEEELAGAEERLFAFQRTTGIIAPEEQAAVIVEGLAELTGRRLALEVQRDALREVAGPRHPHIQRLDLEIGVLEDAIAKVGASPDGPEGAEPAPGDGGGIPGSLAGLSDLMMEYVRLLRNVKVQETLHEYLVTQHEFYRIQEVRDTPTVQILEEAVPAEKKTKPARAVICIVATLLAFGGSVIFFELLERLRESTASGGLFSQIVEGLGGGPVVRRLRGAPQGRT